MKIVLLQQYLLLEKRHGSLADLYRTNTKQAMKVYAQDGLLWVEQDEGLPELFLLSSTEKLLESLEVSPADLATLQVPVKDVAVEVAVEVAAAVDAVLVVEVDKLTLESSKSQERDDAGEAKKEKEGAATDEAVEGDSDPKEAKEAEEKVQDPQAPSDAVDDGTVKKPRAKAANKKKEKPGIPPEYLPFQNLQRVDGLADRIDVALEDARRIRQRDYSAVKKKHHSSRRSGGRNGQRLAALEHQRRRLHDKLSIANNNNTNNDDDDDNNTNNVGDASAEETYHKEDPWLRLVRFLNSVRVITQLLVPMLLHESRNDKLLRIGNVTFPDKKYPQCWLLSCRVFSTASHRICKKQYSLLNELYSYLGLPRDYQVTMESTVWVQALDQLMETVVVHQLEQENTTAPSWTNISPFQGLVDADRSTALIALTRELDQQFMVDTAGEDPEQHARYLASVTKLHDRINTVLKQKYPTARLSIYGSCLSDLSLAKSSDVDLSLYLDRAADIRKLFEKGHVTVKKYEAEMKNLVYGVTRKLEGRPNEFTEMQPVAHARVPVVKGRALKLDNPHTADGSLHFDCCFLNDIAVANSGLIREYSLVDPRVKQVMIAVKRWAKANNINSAQDNSLSSYAWMNMVIFYLQCAGLVPNLQDAALMKKAGFARDLQNEWNTINNLDTFFLTWEQASPVWEPPVASAELPASALLYGFFRFYARDFPCALCAISIKRGPNSSVAKTSFRKCAPFICIEDPFETFDSHCPHDLGAPASDSGSKNLVYCLQEAESFYRKTVLSLLEEGADQMAVTSLWPVSTKKVTPPAGDTRNNNGGRGNAKFANAKGRAGRQQKQTNLPTQKKDAKIGQPAVDTDKPKKGETMPGQSSTASVDGGGGGKPPKKKKNSRKKKKAPQQAAANGTNGVNVAGADKPTSGTREKEEPREAGTVQDGQGSSPPGGDGRGRGRGGGRGGRGRGGRSRKQPAPNSGQNNASLNQE
jgi:hypothetical protein